MNTIAIGSHLVPRPARKAVGSMLATIQRRLPFNRAGDRIFLTIEFAKRHRRWPRLRGKLFSDYLYGLQVTDEMLDPLRGFVTDKEHLKIWVRSKIGDAYNVPTIAILRDKTAAAAFDYPHRCVIKPTHASGLIIMRRGGEPVDLGAIRSWFGVNHYKNLREANYRALKPKVIVEPILFDDDNIADYKIFCLHGVPKLIQVDIDRRHRHARALYSRTWVRQDYGYAFPQAPTIERPDNLEEMLAVARRLSEDFNFMRVDLYTNGSEVRVGELTSCPGVALERFDPPSAEREASRLLFAPERR